MTNSCVPKCKNKQTIVKQTNRSCVFCIPTMVDLNLFYIPTFHTLLQLKLSTLNNDIQYWIKTIASLHISDKDIKNISIQ